MLYEVITRNKIEFRFSIKFSYSYQRKKRASLIFLEYYLKYKKINALHRFKRRAALLVINVRA